MFKNIKLANTMKIKLIFIFAFALFSCSKKTEAPEVLYNKSVTAIYKGNYNTANTLLQQIDEEYPYTEYAKNASILLAYVNYRNEEYSLLIPVIDIFVKTNPKDSAVPYLLYLKAMSFYTQIDSFKRDKEILLEFKSITEIMVKNFPNLNYTSNLQEKYSYITNTLALGELDVAIQYQKGGNCVAAIPRYIGILNWNEDAFYSNIIRKNLASCFDSIGMKEKGDFFRKLVK